MPDTPDKERSEQAEEILDRFPEIGPPKPRSFLEWSGSRQMTAVLAVICVMAFGCLLSWTLTQPTLADAQALAGSLPDGQTTIQAFTQLRDDHAKNYRDMFQSVVLSGLVPLFTLLAGYVFGRGRAGSGEDS